jgi:hypothetical protein
MKQHQRVGLWLHLTGMMILILMAISPVNNIEVPAWHIVLVIVLWMVGAFLFVIE